MEVREVEAEEGGKVKVNSLASTRCSFSELPVSVQVVSEEVRFRRRCIWAWRSGRAGGDVQEKERGREGRQTGELARTKARE